MNILTQIIKQSCMLALCVLYIGLSVVQAGPKHGPIPSKCLETYIETGAKPAYGDDEGILLCMTTIEQGANITLGNYHCLGNASVEWIPEYCGHFCSSSATTPEEILLCFEEEPNNPPPDIPPVLPPYNPDLPDQQLNGEKNKGDTCEKEANPCNPASGNKYQAELDYISFNGDLHLKRYYNSLYPALGFFGYGWSANGLSKLEVASVTEVKVVNADGRGDQWTYSSTGWLGDPDNSSVLGATSDSYRLRHLDNSQEIFNLSGQLIRSISPDGLITRYAYDSNDRLSTITSPFGRQLRFTYQRNLIHKVITPDGDIVYNYSNIGNLTYVNYPDGSIKQYHYEDSRYPHHLTGISDENAVRYATWTYRDDGKAASSEHAGGVEKVTFDYTTNQYGYTTSTVVTGALGDQRTYNFELSQGQYRVTGLSGDECRTCGNGFMKTRSYDANGFLDGYTDWKGHSTTWQNNAKGLTTQITQAVGSPEQRTIGIDWYAGMNLPDFLTETKRTTDFDYNTQGQLLGYTQEDLTTNKQRTVTYTYHPEGSSGAGLVATIDGARTDVSDVTRFAYTANGDLSSITNALDQVVQITDHDTSGRPLTLINANGSTFDLRWDERGRLRRMTQDDTRTLEFDYYPNGLLERLELPNSSDIHYYYDDAQRLTRIEDALGNQLRVVEMDKMGNVKRVELVNGDDEQEGLITAEYNQLSQLKILTGYNQSESQQAWQESLDYDDNHNLTDITNRKGHHYQAKYDALNRLAELIDPDNHLVTLDYDAQDNLTDVADAKSLTTSYTVNGFNEVTRRDSPDTGVTVYGYDTAGNLSTITDARGITTRYHYDALNRLQTVRYPDASAHNENVDYVYDDCPNGVGRLCQITQESGLERYEYDPYGNRVKVIKQELGTSVSVAAKDYGTYTTTYFYDNLNQLGWITYPSGNTIYYGRDSLGRITNVRRALIGGDIITSREYRSDGRWKQQTLASGANQYREYDLSGRMFTNTHYGQSLSDPYYAQTHFYDDNSNLRLAFGVDRDHNYDFDALDRIIEDTNDELGITTTFDYDANNNRSEVTIDGTKTILSYANNSNHLTQVGSQSVSIDTSGRTQVDQHGNAYTYNLLGRLRSLQVQGNPTAQYVYNAQQLRSRKTVNGVTRIYHYDHYGNMLAEHNADGSDLIEYVYADGERVAMLVGGSMPAPEPQPEPQPDPQPSPTPPSSSGGNVAAAKKILPIIVMYLLEDDNASPTAPVVAASKALIEDSESNGNDNVQVYYYINDHLHTPHRLVDEDGNIAWEADYDAFGQANISVELVKQNHRFPGQYYDQESSLHYNWFRYYDAQTGRYITSDPIGLAGGLNTFAYVGGNPLKYIDPLGLSKRGGRIEINISQPFLNTQYNSLLSQIRQIEPSFRPPSSLRRVGSGVTRNEVRSLQQSLTNAQNAGFCGPGASQMSGFLNNGQVSMQNIYQIVPSGTPNLWRPTQNLQDGFRYQWQSNGVRFKLWGHGPNPNAPAGSNSANGSTVRLQVNNRHVSSNGTTVGNPNNPANANGVHIPLVP